MPFKQEVDIKAWRPTPKQELFLKIPDSIYEAFYGGALGGGKSEIIILHPILRGYHQEPRFHGCIFRRTFPQLESSLIPRAQEYYTAAGAKYNATKHIFTFPSGARIRMCYLEADANVHEHDTNEYHYIGWDELTHFTNFQYTYLFERNRSSTNLPAYVRAASNPGNIGHLWVYQRFVKPAPNGGVKLVDERSGSTRIFIQAKLQDNPHILENDPGYVSRLNMLPEQERKAKLDGDWEAFAGQAFSEFRKEHDLNEPDNALHVIPPFQIPDYWPRVLAIDWGRAANTSAMWGTIDPVSRLILYREYLARELKIADWAADIKRMSQGEHITALVMDPSAWADRGDPMTVAEQFAKVFGRYPERADNDRIGGRQLIHEMLRWKHRPPRYIPPEGFSLEKYNRIYRFHGEKIANDYQLLFAPDPPETNLPKLQIFSTCNVRGGIVEVFPILVSDEKRPEDVAEFDGDDPYDCLRYLCKRAAIISNSKDQKGRAERARIEDEYNTDRDATRYHMRMRHHAEKNKKVVAISGFRVGKVKWGSRGRTSRANWPTARRS